MTRVGCRTAGPSPCYFKEEKQEQMPCGGGLVCQYHQADYLHCRFWSGVDVVSVC